MSCEVECRAVLERLFREWGNRANFSTTPPLFDRGYEQLGMRCPHGVLWYAEPTNDQIAEWIRDQVP